MVADVSRNIGVFLNFLLVVRSQVWFVIKLCVLIHFRKYSNHEENEVKTCSVGSSDKPLPASNKRLSIFDPMANSNDLDEDVDDQEIHHAEDDTNRHEGNSA